MVKSKTLGLEEDDEQSLIKASKEFKIYLAVVAFCFFMVWYNGSDFVGMLEQYSYRQIQYNNSVQKELLTSLVAVSINIVIAGAVSIASLVRRRNLVKYKQLWIEKLKEEIKSEEVNTAVEGSSDVDRVERVMRKNKLEERLQSVLQVWC